VLTPSRYNTVAVKAPPVKAAAPTVTITELITALDTGHAGAATGSSELAFPLKGPAVKAAAATNSAAVFTPIDTVAAPAEVRADVELMITSRMTDPTGME
jgi:hypothetical protein